MIPVCASKIFILCPYRPAIMRFNYIETTCIFICMLGNMLTVYQVNSDTSLKT